MILTEGRIKALSTFKHYWGIFLIKDNNILLESWEVTHGTHYSMIDSGKILNDTPFIISERYYNIMSGAITNLNRKYQFFPY